MMWIRGTQWWADRSLGAAPTGLDFKDQIEKWDGSITTFVAQLPNGKIRGGRRLGSPVILNTTKSFGMLGLSRRCYLPSSDPTMKHLMESDVPFSKWIS